MAVLLLLTVCALSTSSFTGPGQYKLTLSNDSGADFSDHTFRLDNRGLLAWIDETGSEYFAVKGKQELPCQLIREQGKARALLVQASLPAGEKLNLKITPVSEQQNSRKRTYAELSVKEGGQWNGKKYSGGDFVPVSGLKVPPQLTDHSFYIRYEGPGWESDKVGYRFYLDWRNAVDVYGKKVDTMVLAGVGLDGYDSYHEMSDWGMDILKVGETLGLGTPAWWNGKKAERMALTDSVSSEIVYSGDLESRIRTLYHGWKTASFKTDADWQLSIRAGSRLSLSELEFTAGIDSFCTGIVKMPRTEILSSLEGEWGYLATWGVQSLNDDELGLVVFFPTARFGKFASDGKSEIVVLHPAQNRICYYFGAAWVKEKNGIRTKEDFLRYLKQEQEKLNAGINLVIK